MSTLKYIMTVMTLSLSLIACFSTPSSGEGADKLIFLHYWTGALSGGINEMTETFNRSTPGITVEATGFEHESFKVGINAMLASGRPPDMFSYWAGAKIQKLVDQGYLAPIENIWQSAKLDEVFTPAVTAACTYDGRKYALPLTQHYVAFFYNKRLFEKHKLAPPQTWGDFLYACKTLKEAGVTPLALGSREKWPAQFWFDYLLLRTAGPKYRERLMTGEASYTDTEVKNAFDLWKKLFDVGYFNKSPNQYDWAEAAQLVHSGEAAMTLMGTWVIGLFDGKLNWKQGTDYDFFRFPVMDNAVPMTALGPIDAIVIPSKGDPAKAKQALAYFSDPGPQMEMSRGSGALSPSRAIPPSFYTPLQGRILNVIRATPNWAFNYDLATPPDVAEAGLNGFKKFVNNPGSYNDILIDLEKSSKHHFPKSKQ